MKSPGEMKKMIESRQVSEVAWRNEESVMNVHGSWANISLDLVRNFGVEVGLRPLEEVQYCGPWLIHRMEW